MPQAPDILKAIFGPLEFKEQPDITAIRRFYSPHTYCLNEAGDIIGLASVGSSLKEIHLPAALSSLQYLNLSDHSKLKSVQFEGDMPHLLHLDLNGNALDMLDLTGDFSALQHLDVSRNQLNQLKTAELPALEYLDLSDNQLSRLSIRAAQLKHAYLVNNQLTDLRFPDPPRELEVLHLKNNQLAGIPDHFLDLTGLKALYLYQNPLSELPGELIIEEESANSLKAIQDYLRASRKKGTIINNRAKLIIVGNGRVGKTSLYRRLAGEPYNKKEKYTHGVQLGKLNETQLPGVNKTDSLDLQVWDFGGQEIFFATHQFFLSEEAVYILAWTKETNVLPYRERDKEQLPFDEKWRSCDYWLENIRLYGKKSPIIMVQTHSDKLANRQKIKAEWEQEPYLANTLNFSAAKDFGLPELKAYLEHHLNTAIPFLGQDFPRTYDNVLQEIRRLKSSQAFISHDQFLEICQTEEIDQGGEETVLTYLKRAGLVVHFDKPLLREIIYIDPNWLTEQVYKLINNHLRAKKGRIDQAYLKEILPEPDYDTTQRAQFIELLKSFELIFEPSDEEGYIAPQYLPERLEPMAKKFYDRVFKRLSLGFVFRFPKFLPDNVMINFLSRYGPYSDQAFWKNGICFSDEKETDCIVRFEEKKRSLFVYTESSPEGYALQREVCQAFVELSKNANAEIALDGETFASWQEVDKYLHLLDPNPEQQFFAIDGQTPLKLADFARFSEKGMHFELDSRKHKKEKNMSAEEVRNLIARARLDEALKALEEILPDRLKSELIQLQSRLRELERKNRLGIIRSDEERIERSQITFSALQLCKDAELPETNAAKPSPPSLSEECKKILFLAANPTDQSRLQTDLEHRILKAELRQGSARDQFVFLPPQFAVTVTELLRAMNDKPNIIHFSGHGMMEGIAITNNKNETQLMPLPALKRLFRQLNGAAEIVILNACYSAEQARAISEFGMHVVGNNLPITDPAAISFSKGFYNGLGEGKDFEDAFNDAMIVVLTENPSASEIIEVWKDGHKLNL